jgi:hypothetical protein
LVSPLEMLHADWQAYGSGAVGTIAFGSFILASTDHYALMNHFWKLNFSVMCFFILHLLTHRRACRFPSFALYCSIIVRRVHPDCPRPRTCRGYVPGVRHSMTFSAFPMTPSAFPMTVSAFQMICRRFLCPMSFFFLFDLYFGMRSRFLPLQW